MNTSNYKIHIKTMFQTNMGVLRHRTKAGIQEKCFGKTLFTYHAISSMGAPCSLPTCCRWFLPHFFWRALVLTLSEFSRKTATRPTTTTTAAATTTTTTATTTTTSPNFVIIPPFRTSAFFWLGPSAKLCALSGFGFPVCMRGKPSILNTYHLGN